MSVLSRGRNGLLLAAAVAAIGAVPSVRSGGEATPSGEGITAQVTPTPKNESAAVNTAQAPDVTLQFLGSMGSPFRQERRSGIPWPGRRIAGSMRAAGARWDKRRKS